MRSSRSARAKCPSNTTGCTNASRRARPASRGFTDVGARAARPRMNAPADCTITPVSDTDVASVCALAREIWLQHYPGIITVRQIEYMLAQRYAPDIIRAQLRSGEAWW